MRWVALVALAVVLPGCTVPASAPLFGGDEVTAKQAYADAEDAALAWRADAALVGAFAFEAREPDFDLRANGTAAADPDIGNGEAVAWAFTFLAADATATFLVDASGHTTLEQQQDAYEGEHPVQDWPVDSDEAVDAARADGRFDAAVASARAVGVALGDNGTGPKWFAFTIGPSFTFAIVDARTGALETVTDAGEWSDWGDWDWNGSWGSWGGDAGGVECGVLADGQTSGSLTAVERTEEAPLDVPSDDATLTVSLAYGKRVPSDEVTFTLLDPDGTAVQPDDSDESDGGGAGSASYAFHVDEGEHTLRVTLEEPAVASDYSLQWTLVGCR